MAFIAWSTLVKARGIIAETLVVAVAPAEARAPTDAAAETPAARSPAPTRPLLAWRDSVWRLHRRRFSVGKKARYLAFELQMLSAPSKQRKINNNTSLWDVSLRSQIAAVYNQCHTILSFSPASTTPEGKRLAIVGHEAVSAPAADALAEPGRLGGTSDDGSRFIC